ncbi:hypothetical protein C8N24_0637 [Solirubrobacter pauli]|uniref:TrbL/VirB6 plasmid conjugal transfer protein n=1 Tax=Solirubrobacter pauli TaxID=166793 RepID=A0A660L733_9ACTN|nr:hypothetical protein [Solirubrobacter pauli]RKQ90822.1 hypothetical protein C8N24_0637 [Solirubrobacter pauli]
MLVLAFLSRLPRWPRLLLFALVLLAIGSSGSGPQDAQALPPIPIGGGLGDIIGAGADAVTGGVGSAAVEGFGALLAKLFSWSAEIINRELLTWLISVPNYAISPGSNVPLEARSNLAELASTTSAMSFAALAAVGTVAGLRYWAAGLSGSGGFEALQGLGRMLAAALFVVAWPWLFRTCADLTNAAARGLMGSGTVLDDTSRLLGVAFSSAISFNFLAIVIAIGAGLLFLALLMCKIVASASTALLYAGMPFAAIAWVIPETAWLAAAAMRAFAVVLVIPLAWALCFATFAAVGMDALAVEGAGSVADALIMPLVALALLWITVSLPRTLGRMALLGGMHSGGFLARTASYVTARRTDALISQALPSPLGRSSGQAASGASSGTGSGGGRAGQKTRTVTTLATTAGIAAAGPAAPAAAAGTGATAKGGSAAAAAQPGPAGAANPRPAPATPSPQGLPSPSWQEIRDRVPEELKAAKAAGSSTTRSDVTAAMSALNPDSQRAVRTLAETKSGRITGEMVHQAARSDIGEPERNAFRVLAAATPELRRQGIDDFYAPQESAPSRPPVPGTGEGVMPTPPGPPLSQPPTSIHDNQRPSDAT